MAFKYEKIGSYMPVACQNGEILIQKYTGEVLHCPTTLNINTEMQSHIFNGMNILFYIIDKDRYYIGRKDGTISGYRLSDNLLVSIASWTPPTLPGLYIVGSYVDDGCNEPLLLNSKDLRTCYVQGTIREFILHEPLLSWSGLPLSAAASVMGKRGLTIYDATGGEIDVYEKGDWVVQDKSVYGRQKRFL